jgi:predicted DsbA family dithiol-disulfide isomerase
MSHDAADEERPMTDRIRFHFDPICPWCWITAKWVFRLEKLGDVETDWCVFSLEITNRGTEEAAGKGHARSALALRTVLAVRDAHGGGAAGRFYAALGTRVHERGEALEDPATVAGALADAGFDAGLADRAADEVPWTRVEEEHAALVERTRSFGVPTIVLDGGAGPAIFGPVIGREPADEEAVELWRHVSWLTRHEGFAELKRERTVAPDHLASWSR